MLKYIVPLKNICTFLCLWITSQAPYESILISPKAATDISIGVSSDHFCIQLNTCSTISFSAAALIQKNIFILRNNLKA